MTKNPDNQSSDVEEADAVYLRRARFLVSIPDFDKLGIPDPVEALTQRNEIDESVNSPYFVVLEVYYEGELDHIEWASCADENEIVATLEVHVFQVPMPGYRFDARVWDLDVRCAVPWYKVQRVRLGEEPDV